MTEGKRSLGEVALRLRGFYRSHGRMPSFKEFAKAINVRSKNAVLKWVHKLDEARIVNTDSTGRMALGPAWAGTRMLGIVEAGFPGPTEEDAADVVDLDEYLIERPEATYLLKVKGDSMKDAGIVEGDLVLAERGAEARQGDIVIAVVDGGWTMKYFKKSGSTVSLEPANKKFKTITPKESLSIAAVVRGVVRKY